LTHEPSVETKEGFLENILSLTPDFTVEHIIDVTQANLVVKMLIYSLYGLSGVGDAKFLVQALNFSSIFL